MRKTRDVVVVDPSGRDHGKVFRLTEMPASQAERWALRALMAVAASGVDLPDGVAGAGMAGIAGMGLRAVFRVPFEQAEPLMDEMMSCVQYIDDPKKPFPRDLYEEDIEDAKTRIWLKGEVFELHTGFSLAGEISRLTETPALTETSESTQTSPSASVRSSRAA